MIHELTTAAEPEEYLGDAGSLATPSPTVLCIDDDPEISRMLQVRLKDYEVDVLRAFSGIQGYWLAVTNQPDAIITDLAMPQGTGDYVLESLKANQKTAHIPVIVFTGRHNDSLFRRLKDNGAAAVLAKPVDFQEILQVLSAYLAI